MAGSISSSSCNPMLGRYENIQEETKILWALTNSVDPKSPNCFASRMGGRTALTTRVCRVQTDAKTSTPRQITYVVQHTEGQNKNVTSLLYERFSCYLPGTFRTPQSASIDMIDHLHISPDGTARPLTQHQVDAVAKGLRATTGFAYNDDMDYLDTRSFFFDDHVILLSEVIPGSTLDMFSINSYHKLSEEQKVCLFTKFGKIALLDFVLGNTDRLIRVDVDPECTQPCEFSRSGKSNFGNIMITWPEKTQDKPPAIYLIDNGIFHEDDPSLCLNRQCNEFYNAFLVEVCEKSSMEDELTLKAIEHMSTAFSYAYPFPREEALNSETCQPPFFLDLHGFGGNAIHAGICIMRRELCINLIPKLTQQMEQRPLAGRIFPALRQSIQDRFELFQVAAAMRASQLSLPMPQPESQTDPEAAAPR